MEKTDTYLESLPQWQKANLELFRKVIHTVAPDVVEEFKWNVPVFLLDGTMSFTMAAFKAHTKYNFILNGALIKDTKNLFNNGFDSKNSRSIDLREGESVDKAALEALVRESVNGQPT